MFEAADKLADARFPVMTMAEIQEEVDAVRSQMRRRALVLDTNKAAATAALGNAVHLYPRLMSTQQRARPQPSARCCAGGRLQFGGAGQRPRAARGEVIQLRAGSPGRAPSTRPPRG